MPDPRLPETSALFVARWSVLVAVCCILTGCARSTMHGDTAETAGRSAPASPIPEELLLDVGIAVFDVPGDGLDGDDDESVFQNDEVLRVERNYVPYVIGKRLQAAQTWGAVRVLPRPSAVIDVTVTGAVMRSDGESLTFRAKATDARGVDWFDKEYRAVAEAGAYEGGDDSKDPFARAYAAVAADMAAGLRELTAEDRARIRAVAEVAFARSLVPEAFARHVTPKPNGGHELRRLPADDDPTLARVREVRQREHLFIDRANDYYEDFTANILGPYDEWRRKAYRSRRAMRELRLKADAQVLLGSARIIAGLARMDHDMPGRLGFDWVTRGLGLIRGAETSEGLLRANADSLREVGSSTQANLLPHTTALENRTARLQQGVDSAYDRLRVILGRLYREEFGGPDSPSPSSPGQAVGEGLGQPAVDPLAQSVAAVSSMTPNSRAERRTSDAKEEIRAGNVEAAIGMLSSILDDGEDLGALAAARIYTLLALGHFAQSDDRQAMGAFNHVVGTACANVCSPETMGRTADRRRHFNPIRPALYEFIAAVQDEIYYGDFDYAIEMLTDLMGDPGAESSPRVNPQAARSLGVFRLRPAERAAMYQTLARAYVGKRDYTAASAVYERILGMGAKVPPGDRDISNESLALIHFSREDYKKSLEYQRDWLRTSNWVVEACAKICPAEPGTFPEARPLRLSRR
ncbi:MAG: hypothetical protein OXI79_13460 [Gammaproteobacteria bacterium]|nr:hypothetical protein [Gammaproteobacteria bacterium]